MAEETAKEEAKELEFEIPLGLELPEDMKVGDQYEVICTVERKGPNKACFIKIAGMPLKGYKEPSEDKPGAKKEASDKQYGDFDSVVKRKGSELEGLQANAGQQIPGMATV